MIASDDLAYALTRAARQVDTDADAPEWLVVAKRQAVEMEKGRLIRAELRKERDQALAERDAAFDLAAQYAALAGVEDSTLTYVADYWARRGAFEKAWQALENARWDTLGVARDLAALAGGQSTTALDVQALAGVVAKELTAVNSAQGGRKRDVGLFARPAVTP